MDLNPDLEASTLPKFTPLQELNSPSFRFQPLLSLQLLFLLHKFLKAIYPLVAKCASLSSALASCCQQDVECDSTLCHKNNHFLIM